MAAQSWSTKQNRWRPAKIADLAVEVEATEVEVAVEVDEIFTEVVDEEETIEVDGIGKRICL